MKQLAVRSLEDRKHANLLETSRAARALVTKNAESFDEACRALEYVGQVRRGRVGFGLKNCESAVIDLAFEAGVKSRDELQRLFTVIREARNEAVHTGAWARHMSSRLVDLLLIIEEALMKNLTKNLTRVEDLMVRSPLVVEAWHLVADARKIMLENSFSFLPLETEDRTWYLISDYAVMQFIRKGGRDASSTSIPSAIDKGLATITPETCFQSDLVDDNFERVTNCPLLVFDETCKDRLVGILTAFDLL